MQVDACVDVAAETSVCIIAALAVTCLRVCWNAVNMCTCNGYRRAAKFPRCSVRILDLGERVALAVKTQTFIRVL